ncbi:hypothetical protein WICMUC_004114 [Wickerhamomyces mucosus]|uniref:Uncharacterized protein n=1 Tax=Wickerhamomyces mucosus TaxID=1378264 RepID=A0A9P8TAS6_9ASCO|nr:hypothetical protein WICMUC_004114 [Wickerhamomyces mucosus]
MYSSSNLDNSLKGTSLWSLIKAEMLSYESYLIENADSDLFTLFTAMGRFDIPAIDRSNLSATNVFVAVHGAAGRMCWSQWVGEFEDVARIDFDSRKLDIPEMGAGVDHGYGGDGGDFVEYVHYVGVDIGVVDVDCVDMVVDEWLTLKAQTH